MCAFVGEPPRGRWEHSRLRRAFVQQRNDRGVPVAECRRLRQRLRSLHDARMDADYTPATIDETSVQEALVMAREIFKMVQRHG